MDNSTRARLGAWIESGPVQYVIVGVIVLNAGVLGLSTTGWGEGRGESTLAVIDTACLVVFVVELSIKLFAFDVRFFRSGWNVFDLIVVGVALVPGSGSVSVLRALRVLRVLRLVSRVEQLRRVVDALMRAIPGMFSVAAVLLIIYYVGAVMATMLFGDRFPEYFGDLGNSSFTLFTVMTLEGWPDVARDVMGEYPLAWLFFVPFIIVTTFAVLNLILAVIVDSMQRLIDEEVEESEVRHHAKIDERVHAELEMLRTEIGELKDLLRDR